MTCMHCKMMIENALKENGIKHIAIDLTTKIVELDLNGKTEEEVRNIIIAKGYEIK